MDVKTYFNELFQFPKRKYVYISYTWLAFEKQYIVLL